MIKYIEKKYVDIKKLRNVGVVLRSPIGNKITSAIFIGGDFVKFPDVTVDLTVATVSHLIEIDI